MANLAACPGDRVSKALFAAVDGSLAKRNGDDVRAREQATIAAEAFANIGWPLVEAACRELAGDVARALAIYRRTGALGDVERLNRKRRGRADSLAPLASLTPRERELALLIAAGHANRAAARSLSITEKAVEKSLTTIYSKLGVASRTQLASLLAQ
ncbi:MAG: hypothetical protein GIX03_15685 [Candidatus Eremiobacteraeota bacterium]|nr:hypothetical protein [Candidatus Eremiobacteraeota bacterium]MBC5804406.1 hypothetical protein [Candidatus Eremiobacteraeota bacterium]MBC5821361.1 hypothetical protein [Candidatus Eremiobacteraeota bacterium]